MPTGSRSARTTRWSGRADIQGRSSCPGTLQSGGQRGIVENTSDSNGLGYEGEQMPSEVVISSLFSTVFCRKRRKVFHTLWETLRKKGGLPRSLDTLYTRTKSEPHGGADEATGFFDRDRSGRHLRLSPRLPSHGWRCCIWCRKSIFIQRS